MVTLAEIKEYFDEHDETDYCISTEMGNGYLKLYRFDGQVEDDVWVATILSDFTIETSNGSMVPFNDGDGCIDDIDKATVEDVVYAILCNMKTSIAEDVAFETERLTTIDEVIKLYGFTPVEVTTTRGYKY